MPVLPTLDCTSVHRHLRGLSVEEANETRAYLTSGGLHATSLLALAPGTSEVALSLCSHPSSLVRRRALISASFLSDTPTLVTILQGLGLASERQMLVRRLHRRRRLDVIDAYLAALPEGHSFPIHLASPATVSAYISKTPHGDVPWMKLGECQPRCLVEALRRSLGPGSAPPTEALTLVAKKAPLELIAALFSLPQGIHRDELMASLLDPLASVAPTPLFQALHTSSIPCLPPLTRPTLSTYAAAKLLCHLGTPLISGGWVEFTLEVMSLLPRGDIRQSCFEAALARHCPQGTGSKAGVRACLAAPSCPLTPQFLLLVEPSERREGLVCEILAALAGGEGVGDATRAKYASATGDFEGSGALAITESLASAEATVRCAAVGWAVCGTLLFCPEAPPSSPSPTTTITITPRPGVAAAVKALGLRATESDPGRKELLSTMAVTLGSEASRLRRGALPPLSEPELALLESALLTLLAPSDTSHATLSAATDVYVNLGLTQKALPPTLFLGMLTRLREVFVAGGHEQLRAMYGFQGHRTPHVVSTLARVAWAVNSPPSVRPLFQTPDLSFTPLITKLRGIAWVALEARCPGASRSASFPTFLKGVLGEPPSSFPTPSSTTITTKAFVKAVGDFLNDTTSDCLCKGEEHPLLGLVAGIARILTTETHSTYASTINIFSGRWGGCDFKGARKCLGGLLPFLLAPDPPGAVVGVEDDNEEGGVKGEDGEVKEEEGEDGDVKEEDGEEDDGGEDDGGEDDGEEDNEEEEVEEKVEEEKSKGPTFSYALALLSGNSDLLKMALALHPSSISQPLWAYCLQASVGGCEVLKNWGHSFLQCISRLPPPLMLALDPAMQAALCEYLLPPPAPASSLKGHSKSDRGHGRHSAAAALAPAVKRVALFPFLPSPVRQRLEGLTKGPLQGPTSEASKSACKVAAASLAKAAFAALCTLDAGDGAQCVLDALHGGGGATETAESGEGEDEEEEEGDKEVVQEVEGGDEDGEEEEEQEEEDGMVEGEEGAEGAPLPPHLPYFSPLETARNAVSALPKLLRLSSPPTTASLLQVFCTPTAIRVYGVSGVKSALGFISQHSGIGLGKGVAWGLALGLGECWEAPLHKDVKAAVLETLWGFLTTPTPPPELEERTWRVVSMAVRDALGVSVGAAAPVAVTAAAAAKLSHARKQLQQQLCALPRPQGGRDAPMKRYTELVLLPLLRASGGGEGVGVSTAAVQGLVLGRLCSPLWHPKDDTEEGGVCEYLLGVARGPTSTSTPTSTTEEEEVGKVLMVRSQAVAALGSSSALCDPSTPFFMAALTLGAELCAPFTRATPFGSGGGGDTAAFWAVQRVSLGLLSTLATTISSSPPVVLGSAASSPTPWASLSLDPASHTLQEATLATNGVNPLPLALALSELCPPQHPLLSKLRVELALRPILAPNGSLLKWFKAAAGGVRAPSTAARAVDALGVLCGRSGVEGMWLFPGTEAAAVGMFVSFAEACGASGAQMGEAVEEELRGVGGGSIPPQLRGLVALGVLKVAVNVRVAEKPVHTSGLRDLLLRLVRYTNPADLGFTPSVIEAAFTLCTDSAFP